MNKIHYSYESSTDLLDIEKYIIEDLASPNAAKNIIEKITSKIRLLEKFPELGAPLSSIVDIDTDYRFLASGNYLSFYRIDGTDIYISRILYGGRDYLSILFYAAEPETTDSEERF